MRSLSARMAVTVLESEYGWLLVDVETIYPAAIGGTPDHMHALTTQGFMSKPYPNKCASQ